MEARVDAVFDSIRYDSSFLALTSGADGNSDADERHAQYARSLNRIREETAWPKLLPFPLRTRIKYTAIESGK